MMSASVFIIIIGGVFAGGVTGRLLDGLVPELVLALIAGFIATIVGAIVCNYVIGRLPYTKSNVARMPVAVIVYSLVGSIAGSLAGYELAVLGGHPFSSGIVGTLAGVLSAVIMVLLMLTYRMDPTHLARVK